ncbi:MAG: hypothetical protein V4649_05085 [Bacteroidota bacterium]
MQYYLLVFFASALVDLVPFIGPPAWTVMVLLQVHYGLDIWGVLIAGVTGSTLGRYIYTRYIPLISSRLISKQKTEDIEFIGQKLSNKGWRVQLFVLLYTLVPIPSTPLFTAAGIARINAAYLLPAFFAGKFISDMVLVFTGDYAAKNLSSIRQGLLSWQALVGTAVGIAMLFFFLFIDWRLLIQQRHFRLRFKIWK